MGGHDRRAARSRHRLAGQAVDARDRTPRPPTPTPASPRRRRSARRSRPSGRTRPACRSRRSCSAAGAARTVPLVTEALRLGARRVPRLDHGLGDHGGAAGRGRQAALRPDGDAAVLRLQHGRLLRPLAEHRQGHRRREAAQALLRQLVPPGRRRPLPVAGLRREQPRAQVGLRAGRRRPPTPSTRRSACCPRPTPSTPTASTSPPTTSETLLVVDADGWSRAIPEIREHFARFGDDIPAPLVDAVDMLERDLQNA